MDELERLRALEVRVNSLAIAYANNATMLAGIATVPDGILWVMAECSLSAAKLIRKAIDGEDE